MNALTFGKKHPGFALVKWVIQARSTNPSNATMLVLHSETEPDHGTVMVCTDGRRMHIVARAPVPPGEYDVNASASAIVLTPSQVNIQFPSWRKVVLVYSAPKTKFEITISKEEYGAAIGRLCYELATSIDARFDIDLFKPLINERWEVTGDTPPKPVSFVSGLKQAVIMPLYLRKKA